MLVRHLVLAGRESDIGAGLARVARDDSGWQPTPAADAIHNRARRRWFERNWPEHYARMEGVATAFGLDVEDDRVDFSYVMAEPSDVLCSAVWCAPEAATDGRARVGRNLDFMTRTVSELFGNTPRVGELPVFSRPFVIESHPQGGCATLVTTIGDLAGCLDGINEHGLVVALLADDESSVRRPSGSPQAGLCETQVARYLLDRCASAADALDALYSTKQYDEWAVAHFLVADETQAFVWERELHNTEHVVRDDGGRLCVTNYLLFRDGANAMPDVVADNDGLNDALRRGRVLVEGSGREPISEEGLWSLLESVGADGSHDDWQPLDRVRTLWHNQFDLAQRSVGYEFYLGDDEDGSARRSPRCTLSLSS